MRIGIMLRTFDRFGGTQIYARNIVDNLLEIDKANEYILIYNDEKHIGSYSGHKNVKEVVAPRCHPILWDQIRIPAIIKQYGIDLIFNTKFSVPLFTKAKKVMVLHGASWYTHPELYGRLDVAYVKATMPIYCKMADFLVSNSELTTDDFINILKVPSNKIKTVLLAAGNQFKKITDVKILESIKKKHNLPDRFILHVSSYDSRKNFKTIIDAYEKCSQTADVPLLVIGKGCEQYAIDFEIKKRGLEKRVVFPGWIEQEDLPAIYNMASVFLFPSVYEEFGIPIVEAMSCGCPIVSSNTGAIPELSNGVALLNDPFDVESCASSLEEILMSDAKTEELRKKGFERAADFSWNKAAAETLEVFEKLHLGEDV